MSRVVNNNRGFLQLLADCPAYQRQFLLKTATPQQLHALVQVLYNVLMRHIPISEENKRILLPYKDALLDLASPNVPYKTKKRVLVQEGSGFIEDVLAPVVSAWNADTFIVFHFLEIDRRKRQTKFSAPLCVYVRVFV